MKISDQVLILESNQSFSALSSAVYGGGLGDHRAVINLHVNKHYNNSKPTADLKSAARKHQVPEPFIGLMTAVFLKDCQVVEDVQGELRVAAIITAGVGNATSAGLSPAFTGQPAGTVNMIIAVNQTLSPGAMVNAVITATEAKTDLFHHRNIQTSSGLQATGTSTDAVVILSLNQGQTISHSGPATPLGHMIGKSVRRALEASLP